MLHKNVANLKRERDIIITPFEIAVLFIAFLVVLFFLFPKGKLEQHILQERSNYDLTAIYLQNLIRLQPDNSELVLSMANTLYQQEKYHLALNLLDVLSHDTDPKIQQKAILTHLNINKIRADKEKDPNKKAIFIRENDLLLQSISHQQFTDINNSKTLYYAALSIGDKQSALNFNATILPLVQGEEAIKWSENLHYLAAELNNKKEDKKALKFLIKHNKPNQKRWLDALIPLLNDKDDIPTLGDELKLEGEQLANFYLANKHITPATDLYQTLYEQEKNKETKTALLLKMISIFRMHNQSAKAANIVRAYEDDYLDNQTVTKKLLKLYLEANHADYAKALSLKIIQQKDIR
jgi:hypothetical protein